MEEIVAGYVEMYCDGCGKMVSHKVVLVSDEGVFIDSYRLCSSCGHKTWRKEFHLYPNRLR